MKFVLYGMPGAGKSTVFKGLKSLEVVKGSETLSQIARKRFGREMRALSESDQEDVRKQFISDIQQRDRIIVDGHYAFGDKVVFTEADGACYDVFLYLYEEPDVLRARMEKSGKNKRYLEYDLVRWQNDEINGLREFCLRERKDFYVIDDRRYLEEFIQVILDGFSSVAFAKQAVEKIVDAYGMKRRICLVDGDKTLSSCDVSRKFLHYRTGVFDRNFYSGFQFWLQAKEFDSIGDLMVSAPPVPINRALLDMVNPEEVVLLTCGYSKIWKRVADGLGIPVCVSGAALSADTKYHITSMLKERLPNANLVAHGDSFSDWYMLVETKGMLWVKNRLSRSFLGRDVSRVEKRYVPWILNEEDDSAIVAELCRQSKSNSGVSGNALAEVHEKMGEMLGEVLCRDFAAEETTMVCCLRSGMFLARGIYRRFNCQFLLFDPHHDQVGNLELTKKNVLFVDAVVNTGESLLRTVNQLTGKQIVVVTGVIQREALMKFSSYPLYTCRVSENKFKGTRCREQNGMFGPDTSDRLFNLI